MAAHPPPDDFLAQQPRGPSGSQPSYRLGAPIALADLLALPPDGNRYSRDEKGRLTLTPPDNAEFHRTPLSALTATLAASVDRQRYLVVPEGSVAFDPIYELRGTVLPPSHHGLATIEPDLACLRRPVRTVRSSKNNKVYAPEGVALVMELLSHSTWRRDLGDGAAEDVDRWRTYLENGVPEYWIFNACDHACGLPPRSCLPLALDTSIGTWADLDAEDARYAPEEYRGRRVLVGGRVQSRAVPGLTIDIEQLWRDAELSSA